MHAHTLPVLVRESFSRCALRHAWSWLRHLQAVVQIAVRSRLREQDCKWPRRVLSHIVVPSRQEFIHLQVDGHGVVMLIAIGQVVEPSRVRPAARGCNIPALAICRHATKKAVDDLELHTLQRCSRLIVVDCKIQNLPRSHTYMPRSMIRLMYTDSGGSAKWAEQKLWHVIGPKTLSAHRAGKIRDVPKCK